MLPEQALVGVRVIVPGHPNPPLAPPAASPPGLVHHRGHVPPPGAAVDHHVAGERGRVDADLLGTMHWTTSPGVPARSAGTKPRNPSPLSWTARPRRSPAPRCERIQRRSSSDNVKWAARSLRATSGGHLDSCSSSSSERTLLARSLTSRGRRSDLDHSRLDGSVLVGLRRQAVAASSVQASMTGDLRHQHHIGPRADQVGDAGVAQHVG